MPLRFHRSISLLPGLRLNVGAGGASLSVGIPGASVNVGSRGTTATLGIPGTGLSFRHQLTAHSAAAATVAPTQPQYPLATGPTGQELRAVLLPDARRVLENPPVREAFELFVKTAGDLAGAGSIFEMMLRPDKRGDFIGGVQAAVFEPRQLVIAPHREPALGPDGHSVVMMGGMYWEFLPGRFYANGQSFDGLSVAMDVTSFQTVEVTPSGDAEIVGRSGGKPVAKYVRIDVTCGDLSTSVAISNIALAGFFVAAYRNYVEVLAGRPYKEVHPYRDLNAVPIRSAPGLMAGGRADPAVRPAPDNGSGRVWKGILGVGALVGILALIGRGNSPPPAPTPVPSAPVASGAAGSVAAPRPGLTTPATPAPPPVAAAPVRSGRTKQASNVRSGPSNEASVVRTVPAGTPVAISETSNGWHRVSLGDGAPIGWIHRSLIE